MPTSGYVPSRDQMSTIVGAARTLYRVACRWQALSHLPGYPVERGNAAALEALFALERALNPRRLAWDQAARKTPRTECWPSSVADGVAWARNLLDLVIERNQLQTLATAATLAVWAADHPAAPSVVSIQRDELKALREVLRLLPKPASLPEAVMEPRQPPTPAQSPVSLSEPLAAAGPDIPATVLLVSPSVPPLVLGKRKPRLTPAQYRVVKALLDAGEQGLSKPELERLCGDAVKVLKRLAKSDPDWNAVIQLAGKKGRRYRIAVGTEPTARQEDTHLADPNARPAPAITRPMVG